MGPGADILGEWLASDFVNDTEMVLTEFAASVIR